jgi:hypothetical protein
MHAKIEDPDRLATQDNRDSSFVDEAENSSTFPKSTLQLAVYLPYGMARKLRSALYRWMELSICVIIPANF